MNTRIQKCGALVLVLFCVAPASAQHDTLDTLLDRGFVAHWLVCGPFAPGLEGGIGGALERGAAPLADKDHMAPIGGIERTRPRHLLTVSTGDDKAIWQRAGAKTPSLDLSPFFPDDPEGVAYAAFYAQAAQEQQAYVNIHSTLGVRVWMNGVHLRDVSGGPLAAKGAARFIVRFERGTNLMVIEAPGAAFETIAAAAGVTLEELRRDILRNRTLLEGASGFEIALTLDPVSTMDRIAYVPRLRHAGTFSGTASNLLQDATLTLFNPTGLPSPPIEIEARVNGNPDAVAIEAPPVAPNGERRVRVPVAAGKRAAGSTVPVNVSLDADGDTASFTTNFPVREPEAQGRTYVISRVRLREEMAQAQATKAALRAARRHISLLRQEPSYGFNLGYAAAWQPVLAYYADVAAELRQAAGSGRVDAWAGFGPLDERIVTGELLVQNLAYGMRAAQTVLGAAAPVFLAWDAPALAPQTPQLLSAAEAGGMLSNLQYGGLHPLAYHLALDGRRVPHRRKASGAAPVDVADLRDMAAVQRRELDAMDIPVDVLLPVDGAGTPAPFYAEAAETLGEAYPSVRFRGGGGRMFFEELDVLPDTVTGGVHVTARCLTARAPGDLLVRPNVAVARSVLEHRTLAAERAAAFAALLGAQYPGEALDLAWRQLLYWSAQGRTGAALQGDRLVDALAAYHEIAAVGEGVYTNALDYIAAMADTLEEAPADLDGVRPLLIFNPTAHKRDDVVAARLTYDTAHNWHIVSDTGTPVPHVTSDHRDMGNRRMSARFRFVAQSVPGFGYRTYYLVPGGRVQTPSRRPDAQIETSRFLVVADPSTGAIKSLVDKASGVDHAHNLLNHFVLLEQDPARLDGGRELWTTGDIAYADRVPAEIEAVVTEGVQELTITAAFGGGSLTRRISLYEHIDRVDFETTLEDVPLDNKLLAVTFKPNEAGRVPVYGERFGALAGRRSAHVLQFRTDGMDNPSGTGLQPALRWFAATPNDHIQIGTEQALPLAPAMIVHGNEPALKNAARIVLEAFAQRGIPADTCADTPPDLDFIHTDATRFLNENDALAHGAGMRVLVGGAGENAVSTRLMEGLPETQREAVLERFKQAAAVLLYDEDVPDGYPPLLTLILGGSSVEQAAEAARRFGESIRGRGVYNLPPDAYLSETPAPVRADTGCALFFRGVKPCSMEADGTLVLAWAHGAGSGQDTVGKQKDRHVLRYALAPFDGDWRRAGIPARAQSYNMPLRVAETDLHSGRRPAVDGMLEVSDPRFVVTGMRPGGYPEAALQPYGGDPRDGVVVRGYAASGTPWSGNFRFFVPLRTAHTATLFGESRDVLEVLNTRYVRETAPFHIDTVRLLPSTHFAHGESQNLTPPDLEAASVNSAYWEGNPGAAPIGARTFSLLTRGELDAENDRIEVVVGNHSADVGVEGVVYTIVPEGWSASPAQFYYELAPGEAHVEEVVVLRGGQRAGDGGLVAWTKQGARTYRAAVPEAGAGYTLDLSRSENQLRVQITNTGGIPLEGIAEVVTLPRWWRAYNAEAPLTAAPRRHSVRTSPFDTQNIAFRLPPEAAGAVVKVHANGHTRYDPVP